MEEGERPEKQKGPLFWTITGNDFGRSILWAKSQPNEMTLQIRKALQNQSS